MFPVSPVFYNPIYPVSPMFSKPFYRVSPMIYNPIYRVSPMFRNPIFPVSPMFFWFRYGATCLAFQKNMGDLGSEIAHTGYVENISCFRG